MKNVGVTNTNNPYAASGTAIPESSSSMIEAGIPYHPHGDSLIPDDEIAHYAGDLNQQQSTKMGADGKQDMLVIQPNTVDMESEVAKTYGVGGQPEEDQQICGIFKSKCQLFVAIGALLLMALAAALMGVFIPPALVTKRDASGGSDNGDTTDTIDPMFCDGSLGCIPDITTLGKCLNSITDPTASNFNTLTLCTGVHTLTEPLQLQVQQYSSTTEEGETSNSTASMGGELIPQIVQIACEEPAIYQQGSPCVLEAGLDTTMFVNVSNPLFISSGDEVNNNIDPNQQQSNNEVLNSLTVYFVDMTFTRPDFNDGTFQTSGANGAFVAPNATLDFLSCSFLDTPLGFYFDALNVTFDLAYVSGSGTPDVAIETDIPAAPAMKFVLYDTNLASRVADAVRPPNDDGFGNSTDATTTPDQSFPGTEADTTVPSLPVGDGLTITGGEVILLSDRPKSHVIMKQSLMENNTCSILMELEVDQYRYGGHLLQGTDIMNNDATTSMIISKVNPFSLAADVIFNIQVVNEEVPSLSGGTTTTPPPTGAGSLLAQGSSSSGTSTCDLCRFENNTSFHMIELNHPGSNVELLNLNFNYNEGNMITVLNATQTRMESLFFSQNGPRRVLDTTNNILMGLPGDMIDMTSRALSMENLVVESNDYATDTIGADSILNIRASPEALAAGGSNIQGTNAACELCTFHDNMAKGGIVSMASYQNADFSGSIFRNNTVEDSIVKHIFGELHTCNNCIFEDNTQQQSIGLDNEAIVFLMGAGRLDKCLFRGNNFNRGVTMVGRTESLGIVTDSCFIDNIFGGDSIIKYGYVPRSQILTAVTSSNYLENNVMAAANTGGVVATATPPCNGVLYGSLGADGTCLPMTAATCAAPIPQDDI